MRIAEIFGETQTGDLRNLHERASQIRKLEGAQREYDDLLDKAAKRIRRRYTLRRGQIGRAFIPKVVGADPGILTAGLKDPSANANQAAEIVIDAGPLGVGIDKVQKELAEGERLDLASSIWSPSGRGNRYLSVSIKLDGRAELLGPVFVWARPPFDRLLL